MNYYEFLRQTIGRELDKYLRKEVDTDYIVNELYDDNPVLPLYNTLTKNDIVKVLPSNKDSKYIKDTNLKDFKVDKTLSKKYNVYYKYTYLALNRDPEKWLDPYSYDFYEFISRVSSEIKSGSHILIIIKDKHDKDCESRYIFNYQYPYKPHYPVDIPDEHLKLCEKLLNRLY